MTTEDGRRPHLDAWYREVEEVTAEVVQLHLAGEHTWCDSLPRRRSEHLARRFQLALQDLGLDATLDNLIVATRDGVALHGTLSHRQVDRLIQRLEILARRRGRR